MKVKIKYETNRNGAVTSVKIPIKDWRVIEKHLGLSEKSQPKRRKKKSKLSEFNEIRAMSSDNSSFSFWENPKEDLYQDFIEMK